MSVPAHDHTTHEHSHGGPKVYALTLAALLVLTLITVFVAGFDFGSINVVVAIAIATMKATLVALVFMHLRHDRPLNGVIAISGFLFLGLLLMFCLTDIDARSNPIPGTVKVPLKAAAPRATGPGCSRKSLIPNPRLIISSRIRSARRWIAIAALARGPRSKSSRPPHRPPDRSRIRTTTKFEICS